MKSLLEMEKEEVVSFLNSALERCGSRNIQFSVVDMFIVMSVKYKDQWVCIFDESWTTVSGFLVWKYSSDRTLFTVSQILLGVRKRIYNFEHRDIYFLRAVSNCKTIEELIIRLELIA